MNRKLVAAITSGSVLAGVAGYATSVAISASSSSQAAVLTTTISIPVGTGGTGPAGPPGPAGPTGPTGPAGPAGTVVGPGGGTITAVDDLPCPAGYVWGDVMVIVQGQGPTQFRTCVKTG